MIARTFRITGFVALAAAFLLTCFMAAGLVFGWWRVLPVQSGSMAPAIPKGAAVIVTPQSFAEIEVGQIIVYDPPTPGTALLVHRVVEVERNGDTVRVRTRGDANTADDPWTAELANPPVWKVRTVVPHAGTVVDLLRNRALRLALFPLALLGLAVAALATLAQMPSVAQQVAAAARRDEDIDATVDATDGAGDGSARPARPARPAPAGRGEAPPPVPMMTTVTASMLRAARTAHPVEPAGATATATLVRDDVFPADWYPDPTGRFALRWYDGARWSEHVATGSGRTTDPLG